MPTGPIIGQVRFTDGAVRPVYRDPDGRQYVLDYTCKRPYVVIVSVFPGPGRRRNCENVSQVFVLACNGRKNWQMFLSWRMNPGVLQMLGDTLEYFGFHVWLAGSGSEAIRLYREHAENINVVLLDVQMPDMDGPETLADADRNGNWARHALAALHAGVPIPIPPLDCQ